MSKTGKVKKKGGDLLSVFILTVIIFATAYCMSLIKDLSYCEKQLNIYENSKK